MSKFIEAVETKNALNFKEEFEAGMAAKVVLALDACKVEVAKKFFEAVAGNDAHDGGGVGHGLSGGVKKVWKKPNPHKANKGNVVGAEMPGKK